MKREEIRLKCLEESIKLVTKGHMLDPESSFNSNLNHTIEVSNVMYNWVIKYSNSNLKSKILNLIKFKKNRQ